MSKIQYVCIGQVLLRCKQKGWCQDRCGGRANADKSRAVGKRSCLFCLPQYPRLSHQWAGMVTSPSWSRGLGVEARDGVTDGDRVVFTHNAS